LRLCAEDEADPNATPSRPHSPVPVAFLPGPAWILSTRSPRNRCPPARLHRAIARPSG